MKAERVYVSYGQIMVYDSQNPLPGLAWTERHTRQGFARQDSILNARTLIEYGRADLCVAFGSPTVTSYERVISVPFRVTSGSVTIDGPEEDDAERRFSVPAGAYTLWIAQRFLTVAEYNGESTDQQIDVFFDDMWRDKSRVWQADQDLAVHLPLLEDAEVA